MPQNCGIFLFHKSGGFFHRGEQSSCCYPEQRDCLRPLAGRICLFKVRFFAKEAQNDMSRQVGWLSDILRGLRFHDANPPYPYKNNAVVRHFDFQKYSGFMSCEELCSCCHPERRDCLRPLAGRICLLKIRFFAKEAQNDLSRQVGWLSDILRGLRFHDANPPYPYKNNAVVRHFDFQKYSGFMSCEELCSCCHPERRDCLRPLAGRIC